jgi:Calcineurin-like phosphoesterase
MRLQLLSDLHLETEDFRPEPAPGAELLVLGGDIDADWNGLERFAGWPVPVLFVAGNHEFDGRDLRMAWPALRARAAALGIRMLERETLTLADDRGRRIRFVATVRWSDFDLLGTALRDKAMRAAGYFARLMDARIGGAPFDAEAIRTEAHACRAWLEAALARRPTGIDATVALTHFAPSARSADPRYGVQASSASFCNGDDDLLPLADLWIHGHLHCRQDYRVHHADGRTTRVVSNARGHSRRGEVDGHEPAWLIEV